MKRKLLYRGYCLGKFSDSCNRLRLIAPKAQKVFFICFVDGVPVNPNKNALGSAPASVAPVAFLCAVASLPSQ
jgi:hypothetical protein